MGGGGGGGGGEGGGREGGEEQKNNHRETQISKVKISCRTCTRVVLTLYT